ncbi:urease accessory protein [Hasllibacter halocynthiae]|uniref:Urease accessory protein UreF n=1 Tax=Hasllibacter halocynthiae TaxID=595589 RepID=A0A2T0X8N6_9RHOB|nr:urease accessory UreF family protein [Hasllibacter halocynthiae]PRY95312.1 urease accessory protein [Hasllibacter halocynthiae]
MAKAEALLSLQQWLSPAFPTGAFAHSHGLEAAHAAGEVGREDIGRWLSDVIAHGAGRQDATILAAVLGGRDPGEMTALAAALAGSEGRWRETAGQGAAMAAALRAAGTAVPDGPVPVVLGLAARPLGLPPATVAASQVQAFASMVLSAAQRLLPLPQTEAQAHLAALRPLVLRTAEAAAATPPEALTTAAFAGEVAAMRHETLQPRMFRT